MSGRYRLFLHSCRDGRRGRLPQNWKIERSNWSGKLKDSDFDQRIALSLKRTPSLPYRAGSLLF
jgi:hypothetical protein